MTFHLPGALLLLLLANVCLAAEPAPAAVTVTAAYARATAPSAANGVVFARLEGGPDALIAADTDVAQRVELHTITILDSGAKRMTPVERIPVPGDLNPGGFHLMLIGLKQPLVEKATVTLRLTFARAGTITASVPVAGIAAIAAPDGAPACCTEP